MARGSITCTPCSELGPGISPHGNDTCTKCAPGTGFNAARTGCELCAPGHVSLDGVCLPCPFAKVPQRNADGRAVVCQQCGNNQIVNPNDKDECMCSAGTYDVAHGFVFCWPGDGYSSHYSLGKAQVRKQDKLAGLHEDERQQLSLNGTGNMVCVKCPSGCTDCGELGGAPTDDYVKAGWGFGKVGASQFHGIDVGKYSDKAVFKCKGTTMVQGRYKAGTDCSEPHAQNVSCPAGYANPMCAVCLPGYGGGTRRPCHKCQQTSSPGWVVAEILAMACGLWGVSVLWMLTQDVSAPPPFSFCQCLQPGLPTVAPAASTRAGG